MKASAATQRDNRLREGGALWMYQEREEDDGGLDPNKTQQEKRETFVMLKNICLTLKCSNFKGNDSSCIFSNDRALKDLKQKQLVFNKARQKNRWKFF
jgi:hypothetical protein